jgi:hypothetical protein
MVSDLYITLLIQQNFILLEMATSCKIRSTCLLGLVVFGLNTSAFGQLRSQNRGEIIDINPASVQMNQTKARMEKYRIITDSLSRYPEENVAYVFNGKLSDDVTTAKRLLFINLDYIETISTSEHDQGGKRLIAVKFRPH